MPAVRISEEPEILPCEAHKTCRSCADDINCGWCASDDACYEGVELGPIFKQCSQWTHTFCHGARRLADGPPPRAHRPSLRSACCADEPCQDRRDCHSCLTNAKCGWCAATATCEEGTAKRSIESACPLSRWMHKHGNATLQCHKADALFLDAAAAEEAEELAQAEG